MNHQGGQAAFKKAGANGAADKVIGMPSMETGRARCRSRCRSRPTKSAGRLAS